jgi:hypothetical protein
MPSRVCLHLLTNCLSAAIISRGVLTSYLYPSFSKFHGDPTATLAFQKVSVAYNVLSNPVHKKRYDQNPSMSTNFASTTNMRAEETLRGAVLGMFNDFLDGDMEVVRTLLRELC